MSRPLTYFGVFVTALATLMLEILLTRIVSVIAWYHLAFFVISLAMLGMTAGAVLVFVSPRLFADQLVPLRLAQSALGFALFIPLVVMLALSQPLMPVSDLMTFVALLQTGGILAVPFILGGITITLALTRTGLPPGLVYGVDLCGAASGCLLVIPLLDAVDAPSAAVLCGAVAALAAVAFSMGAGRKALVPLLLAIALVGLGVGNAAVDPHPLRPAWVKGKREDHDRFEYVKWNTYSRVTVDKNELKPPMLWSVSPKAPPKALQPVPWRMIEIDGAAGTMLAERGDLIERHGYLQWDLTSFAHLLRPVGPAAVIGVGGGRDVTMAITAGHKPVVGIEINDLIVDLHHNTLAGYSGLANLEDVVLVADEARSHLSRDRREYSVITMSLIDTWASTGAGAYTLSENGLYTVEAWTTFFSRLMRNGIFSVSRWYNSLSPGETARMTALAMEALWKRGAKQPSRHIVLLQHGEIATLLASPSPFSPGDVYRVHKLAKKLGFNLLAAPLQESNDPTIAGVIGQRTRRAMWRYAASQTLDLTPPTDMRPFFFNMLKPTRWITTGRSVDELDLSFLGNVQATQTLLYAVAVGLLLTLATVAAPLLAHRRKRAATVHLSGKSAAKSPLKPQRPAGPARMVLSVPDVRRWIRAKWSGRQSTKLHESGGRTQGPQGPSTPARGRFSDSKRIAPVLAPVLRDESAEVVAGRADAHERLQRAEKEASSPSRLPLLDVLAAALYFALIGLGFMFVEMGLLSRLNVLIGQPTVTLAVLLGGIILFAGLGSMLSNLIPMGRRWVTRLYPLLPAVLVIAAIPAMERVLGFAMAGELDLRVAASLALLAPPALALGICFPLGLSLVERRESQLARPDRNHCQSDPPSGDRDSPEDRDDLRHPDPHRDRAASGSMGPWLWGINGAFGVCASGLALGCSMAWGIQTTLWIGAACYLALLPATWRLAR